MSKYKEEKEMLVNKLLSEFIKDKDTIQKNLQTIMNAIQLVAKSENYVATITLKLEEKVE